MDQNRIAPNDIVSLAGALWKLLCRDYPEDLRGFENGPLLESAQLGIARDSGNPSFRKTENVGRDTNSFRNRQDELAQNSMMTVASFVENKFIPEHVALKRSSGRAHYKSMLKHVLRPEEVDQMFRGKTRGSTKKLKAVPGWPYLSDVRLCEARPDHVSRLISAAMFRGYSIQTVKHIRNIVSAIFSHAKQEQFLLGINPAKSVRPPELHRKRSYTLTLEKAKEALGLMASPAREMTLLSIFTGMNLTEILGLQWRFVNLTEAESNKVGNSIAPRTIAVRNQLYRGRLECVKKNRLRDLPIQERLLQILLKLRSRGEFVGPDDFVFVCRVGTPVNQNNLLARRIRPVAKQLGVPSVSCQAFRFVRKALIPELEKQGEEPKVNITSNAPARGTTVLREWRCPSRRGRIHFTGDSSHQSSINQEFAKQ
jgi:integrase